MTTTLENKEQDKAKKGDTKELDLNELKKSLAQEEAELERLKRLKRLKQQEEKTSEISPTEDQPMDDSKIETDKHERKNMSPQELRDARRYYWQQKQKEEERKKKPYNHFPSFFYAGFWFRLFAFIIDLILIWSINRLVVQTIFLLLRLPLIDNDFSAYSLSKLVVYLLYFVLLTKATNGQTVGKIIFGLRLISFKEEQLSWGTVLIRECFGRYILKTFPFIYLMVLFTQEKQHLADFFSDTAVVSENLIRASKLSLEEQPK